MRKYQSKLSFIRVNNILRDLILFQAGCQFLHLSLQYFMVSNYAWMFCEGLYLHTILVVAFISESKIMKWFILLGWGAPALITSLYALVRGLDPQSTTE